MIEQFYPWYYKYYDMAEGEDGGGGDDDGGGDDEEIIDEGGSEDEDAPTDDVAVDEYTPQVVPIIGEDIKVSTIPGNKYLQGLSMPYLNRPLLSGDGLGSIPSEGASINASVTGSPGAKFYLDIVDIDDDSIFSLSNVDVPVSGKNEFTINFPRSTVVNKYKINLRAGDGTRMNTNLPSTDPMWTIHQYVDPTITFTRATGTATGVTYSGADVTFKAPPYSNVSIQTNPRQSTRLRSSTTSLGVPTKTSKKLYGEFGYAVTAAKSGAKVYIKDTAIEFVNNTIVKKIVEQKVANSNIVYLNDVSNLYVGMIYSKGVVTKTKVADINSITIKVSDVRNLTVGMSLSNTLETNVRIISIDNNSNHVVLSKSVDISNRSLVSFNDRSDIINIKSIDADLNKVTLQRKISLLEAGSLLEFKNDEMQFSNTTAFSGSGSASAVVTNNIKLITFGAKDVTFTFQPDDIFTLKPNAHDQRVIAVKETAIDINVLVADNDDNVSGKTPSTVRSPVHGKITGSYGAGDGTITYTPNVGFIGEDSFDFKVNDGTTNSDNKTIFITVHK